MNDESGPFAEGKLAAESGLQLADNPYEAGSSDAREWEKGFAFVAKFGEDGEIPSDV